MSRYSPEGASERGGGGEKDDGRHKNCKTCDVCLWAFIGGLFLDCFDDACHLCICSLLFT